MGNGYIYSRQQWWALNRDKIDEGLDVPVYLFCLTALTLSDGHTVSFPKPQSDEATSDHQKDPAVRRKEEAEGFPWPGPVGEDHLLKQLSRKS